MCFYCFDLPQFRGERMAAVAALLWLFGAAGLALTYLLSFAFSVRPTCFAPTTPSPSYCHISSSPDLLYLANGAPSTPVDNSYMRWMERVTCPSCTACRHACVSRLNMVKSVTDYGIF